MFEGKCCVDCAMFVVNNDASGASDSWNFKAVQEFLMEYRVVVSGDIPHFVNFYPCDVCGGSLAGDRYDIVMDQC